MLTLTRKTDYALVALATMADVGANEDQPLSARQIAEKYGMPLQVLVKVLKDLQKADIVGSTRGAHGGYYLLHRPEAVSLADVSEALEGRVRLTPCCGENTGDMCAGCGMTKQCPISGRVKALNDKILGLFNQVTLADLLEDSIEKRLDCLNLTQAVNT